MSIFGSIMGKVFGKEEEEQVATTSITDQVAAITEQVAAATEAAATETAEVAEEAALVDVAAVLTEKNGAKTEDLDWKASIVDLLKVLDLDSSFGARKELAVELGYAEADIESKGSAEMNTWLHSAVLSKLADNGGSVPSEFLA